MSLKWAEARGRRAPRRNWERILRDETRWKYREGLSNVAQKSSLLCIEQGRGGKCDIIETEEEAKVSYKREWSMLCTLLAMFAKLSAQAGQIGSCSHDSRGSTRSRTIIVIRASECE